MLITRVDVKIIEVVSKNKSLFQLINLYPNSIYGVSASPPSTFTDFLGRTTDH